MSQQINLYESRLRPRHDLATGRNLGVCTLVLLVLVTGFSLWARFEANRKTEAAAASQKLLADEQEKLSTLSKMTAERRVSPGLAAELENAKAVLAMRQEVMDVLDSGKLGNTRGFSAFMSGFARQTPAELWLTGFQVTTGGEEIEIRGRLLDPSRLPGYVQRLSSEPVFQGRRFAALEMQDVDPDDPKANPSASAKTAGKPASPSAAVVQPRLPRFVEFVLRSENIVGTPAGAQGGMRP